MVKNTDMHKRASKKDKEGREFGHMAEIEGIIADDPNKVRGDRCERLLVGQTGIIDGKFLRVFNTAFN